MENIEKGEAALSISTLQKEINKQLDSCFEEMVEIRRHFHMYPELSFQEEKPPHLLLPIMNR